MSDQEVVSAIVADLSDSERLRLLAFFMSDKAEVYEASLKCLPRSGGGLQEPDSKPLTLFAVAGK
jgi:hypothetical protein